MDPFADQRHEHDVILRVAAVMARLAERAEAGAPVDAAALRLVDTFLAGFVHGCHHRKEEQALFPVLATKGAQIKAGPVRVLSGEHEAGHVLMERLRDAGARADATAAGKLLETYATLLRSHIAKENEIIFPLAAALLTPAEKERMAEQFEAVERELDEHRFHREMETAVERLEAAAPATPPPAAP